MKPDWSKEQKASGERTRQAWEEFLSEAEKGEKIASEPFLNPEQAKIEQVRARYESELMRYPNVVGVSVGIRTKQSKPTGEPCLVVFVEKKISRDKLDKSEILPNQIEGIPVDVVEVGKIDALPMK